jgi:Leucine-rich repeat (LRR) protein
LVEDVDLSGNEIRSLDNIDFQNIKVLYIDDNKIKSISNIDFRNIHTLSIS